MGWNEDERDAWEFQLSDGRGVAVKSEAKAKKQYPNLFKQGIVYYDGFSDSLKLKNKGEALLKKIGKFVKESVNEALKMSFSKHSSTAVDVIGNDGRKIHITFDGGNGQPKYFSFPGEKTSHSIHDKRGKEYWKNHGKEIGKWYNKESEKQFKQNNESVNESSEPLKVEIDLYRTSNDRKKVKTIKLPTKRHDNIKQNDVEIGKLIKKVTDFVKKNKFGYAEIHAPNHYIGNMDWKFDYNFQKGNGYRSFTDPDTATSFNGTHESVNEAKDPYQVYHPSYTSALHSAEAYANKKGYEVDKDDWWQQISTGPKKPGKGKTNRATVSLTKNGKPNNSTLAIQVYNRGVSGNTYELNCYVNVSNKKIKEDTDRYGNKRKDGGVTYKVVDGSKTINSGIPKSIAQKLANKKKGWKIVKEAVAVKKVKHILTLGLKGGGEEVLTLVGPNTLKPKEVIDRLVRNLSKYKSYQYSMRRIK